MNNVLKILSLKESEYDDFIESTLSNISGVKSIHPCFNPKHIVATTAIFKEGSIVSSGTAPLTFDDNNIYKTLFNILKQDATNYDLTSVTDIDKLCITAVQKAVFTYYGNGKHNETLRYMLYKLSYDKDVPLGLSEFKGKSCSECTERAMLSHNFFKMLGYNSMFVEGNITLNNSSSLHAYGLVEFSDGIKIYDLVCSPTVSLTSNLPNPVMCTVCDHQIAAKMQEQSNIKEVELDKPNVEDVRFTSQKGNDYVISYGDGGTSMEE